MIVVAEAAQAGERPEQLLGRQARADFDRYADDHASRRAHQTRELVEDPPALGLEAVLEHFHARHDVPPPHLGQSGGPRHREPHARQVPEPRLALRELRGIHVHPYRLGEVAVRHGDKGAVAAPVVEQSSASVGRHEPQGEIKPAAMAPGDDAAAAVNLFARVVARTQQIVRGGHGSFFRMGSQGCSIGPGFAAVSARRPTPVPDPCRTRLPAQSDRRRDRLRAETTPIRTSL